jgi:hypothetical protein
MGLPGGGNETLHGRRVARHHRRPVRAGVAGVAVKIQYMPGNGLITRAYWMWGVRRDVARRHLRRKYAEGVQLAFQYWDDAETTREGLYRLADAFDLSGLRAVLDDIPPVFHDGPASTRPGYRKRR